MTIRDEAFKGKPISAFIIDAHTHIGPNYMKGWYQAPEETSDSSVMKSMDRLGIDCIVTSPHPIIKGMMVSANDTAAAAISKYPKRIYGYISICPNEGMEAVRKEIKKYGEHPGFVGFKFLAGYHGSLSQREYQYAAGYANEKSAVVLTHTWGGNPPLSEVEELAQNNPQMNLLCAHQGGGSADFSKKLAGIIKRCPNLYMELCGSLVNTLSVEDMVALAGENRVIYGSDMINLDPRYDFGRVVFSPLNDSAKKKLLSENFLSLIEDSQMGKIII